MIWSFFKNNGGQESGFHDAGVETFKGNLERYLAREIIQNSLDARDDPKKPVLVKFELLQIPAFELPDLKSLAATFKRCADYWPRDTKATDFFERAEKLACAKKVTTLRAGDYNTKGVTGSDTDRDDGWYSLIRCSGASPKWAGEGGSFGIGKNAPFAASRMRVVLYSTLTKRRTYSFQGVARLVSHNLPKGGGIAQHIGYLGEGVGSSVRKRKDIPPRFVRSKPGTDLMILGYEGQGSWEKDLIFSVLENFWPAIHFGDLEVIVAGTRINKKSLADLLDRYSTEGEFTAHLYYRAFTAAEGEGKRFSASLPTLKKVEVRLLAGEQRLPKEVAMVRKTGMIIFHRRFHSLVPYCGVFMCRNDTGNALLRDMEPPRHDDWDADHPEKGSHRKTESEFTSYIRDCVRQLAPADNEKVLAIPDLSQYLPDDDDTPDVSFEGEFQQELSKRESFNRIPEMKKINGRKLDRTRKPMQPDDGRPGDGDLETEQAAGGAGSGGGDGSGTNDTDGGSGGGAGGSEQGGAGSRSGSHDGRNANPAIPIRGRVFAKDLAKGVYTVIAEPLKSVKGDVLLILKAIGDDATGSVVRFSAARGAGGKSLDSPRPGVLGPVRFSGKDRLLVDVTLVEPRKLAMEVEAHEAE
jgi:hypothetical protein